MCAACICFEHNFRTDVVWLGKGRANHYERPVQKLTSLTLKHYQIIFRQYFFQLCVLCPGTCGVWLCVFIFSKSNICNIVRYRVVYRSLLPLYGMPMTWYVFIRQIHSCSVSFSFAQSVSHSFFTRTHSLTPVSLDLHSFSLLHSFSGLLSGYIGFAEMCMCLCGVFFLKISVQMLFVCMSVLSALPWNVCSVCVEWRAYWGGAWKEDQRSRKNKKRRENKIMNKMAYVFHSFSYFGRIFFVFFFGLLLAENAY